MGELDRQQRELAPKISQFACDSGLRAAFFSKAQIDELAAIDTRLQQASDLVVEREGAVESLEDPDVRLKALPPKKRAAAEQLQKAVQEAADALLTAESEAAEAAAQKRMDRAEAELEKSLPPVDKHAHAAAEEQLAAAVSAQEKIAKEYSDRVEALTPKWLAENRRAIKRLAFSSERGD